MPNHDYDGADLTEIIRQHMHKTVVMVDQQHSFPSQWRPGATDSGFWRIAAQRHQVEVRRP